MDDKQEPVPAGAEREAAIQARWAPPVWHPFAHAGWFGMTIAAWADIRYLQEQLDAERQAHARVRAAAQAFETSLSDWCDNPERDALLEALAAGSGEAGDG